LSYHLNPAMEEFKMTEGKRISRRKFFKGAAAAGLFGGLVADPSQSEAVTAKKKTASAPGEYTTFETDVLVIGAGVGGVESACAAARMGVNVIIVDKKKFGRCGSSGTKSMAMNASSWLGIQGDNVELHLANAEKGGEYLVDERLARIILQGYAEIVPPLLSENYGNIHMRDDQGRPVFLSSNDKPRAWAGYKLPNHALEAQRLGCKILEYTTITRLLTDKTGAVVGATAINFHTGDFYVIRAKSTVLATGGDGHIWGAGTTGPGHSQIPYGITGDGHAMAAALGAEFKDLEFRAGEIQMMYPVPFLRGAQNTELVDKNGEKVILAVPAAERTRGSAVALYKARIEGRSSGSHGGLLAPMSLAGGQSYTRAGKHQDGSEAVGQWPLSEREHNTRIWMKRGLTTNEMVEMDGSHGHCFGGVASNERSESGIPGLYVAGEISMHSGAGYGAFRQFSSALVTGRWAGQNSAARAKTATVSIDRDQIAKEYDRVFEILYAEPSKKLRVHIVRNKARDAAWKGAGALRSDKQCAEALADLDRIEKEDLPRMYVADKSKVCNIEWMEALEAVHIITVARLNTVAARTRTESRASHIRNEYPDTDNDTWLKTVYVKMVNGKPSVTTRPVVATLVKAPSGKTPMGGGTIPGF
jgi:succinate dehydrogenase/fumarate reductase flavoprotein subunit